MEPEEIHRRFGASILRRCRVLLGAAAAEDGAQEVFLTIMDKASQVKDVERMGAWVYQLTTRHCLNLLRARRRRTTREESVAVAAWQDRRPVDPYERYSAKDVLRSVTEGLDDLAQQIFVYRYLDGMTLEEVAEMTHRSVRTVTTRMRKLEQHLAARLRGELPRRIA